MDARVQVCNNSSRLGLAGSTVGIQYCPEYIMLTDCTLWVTVGVCLVVAVAIGDAGSCKGQPMLHAHSRKRASLTEDIELGLVMMTKVTSFSQPGRGGGAARRPEREKQQQTRTTCIAMLQVAPIQCRGASVSLSAAGQPQTRDPTGRENPRKLPGSYIRPA